MEPEGDRKNKTEGKAGTMTEEARESLRAHCVYFISGTAVQFRTIMQREMPFPALPIDFYIADELSPRNCER